MRIDEADFHLVYDTARFTVFLSGSLRMSDLARFDGIRSFLLEVYHLDTPALILDFTELEFMNSAGISVLCRYILAIKDLLPVKDVTLVGNGAILWQRKSFENLRKIWDHLALRFT
jgi:hypothetical protein